MGGVDGARDHPPRRTRRRQSAAGGAGARVASARSARARATRDKPARRRLGWAMFAAGAACAAAIAFVIVPRSRGTDADHPGVGASGHHRPRRRRTRRRRPGHAGAARAQRAPQRRGHAHRRARLAARPRQAAQHDAPFIIETPAFRARVVGTVLRIVAHEDASASIAVGHGAVEVTPRGGAPRLVRAGERWPAARATCRRADEIARMGAADLEGAGVASFGGASPLPQPVAPAPPRRRRRATRCTAKRPSPAGSRVADDTDPVRAESALYQAGWIRMHELARSGVRARHLGAAALALPARRLARRGADARSSTRSSPLHRTRAAEVEIADYLRAHPTGLRSAEMHFVRGTLLRNEIAAAVAPRTSSIWRSRIRQRRGRRAHAPLAPAAAERKVSCVRLSLVAHRLLRGRAPRRRLQAHRRRRLARLRHLARLLAARHHLLRRRPLRRPAAPPIRRPASAARSATRQRRVRGRRHRRRLQRRRRLRIRPTSSAASPRRPAKRAAPSTPASAPATRRAIRRRATAARPASPAAPSSRRRR